MLNSKFISFIDIRLISDYQWWLVISDLAHADIHHDLANESGQVPGLESINTAQNQSLLLIKLKNSIAVTL